MSTALGLVAYRESWRGELPRISDLIETDRRLDAFELARDTKRWIGDDEHLDELFQTATVASLTGRRGCR